MREVALIGNPNCGKTTLFNALTGARQHVGNWPGVTVEKKTGRFDADGQTLTLVDLPGAYTLDDRNVGVDEQIAQDYLASDAVDVIVNVVDAASLSRSLFLTLELLELGKPVIVALNMADVAKNQGIEIDTQTLEAELGVPVVEVVARDNVGIDRLLARVPSAAPPAVTRARDDAIAAFEIIDTLVDRTTEVTPVARTPTDRIDAIALNRYAAFPLFLLVMYLLFLFSINIGSAFIDFFDLIGLAVFVEVPRTLMTAIALPDWLVTFVADGVGGGVQLVMTFIPVIACLFLALSMIEDSGYMARVAFIVDRLLSRLGLPGKAFVPLIVGFGCNVPAVMASRSLDQEPDRILTTLMAPYMSCGARLTVYALFAAAFFPSNGQNVVFALYIIGIAVAVTLALITRRYLLPTAQSAFVMEIPPYHRPRLRNVLMYTWIRLKGFVSRAGKAIVVVVIFLNVLNSIGTDGSIGNQDTEQSVLSEIGKSLTPAFAPMGIREDNWPATVGIFTGIFAKEVVVGTLDALYSPAEDSTDESIGDLLTAAVASVPANLADLGSQLGDPLGLDLGDLDDLETQASEQAVELGTIAAMRTLFDGTSGAFAYLLFILLYMPCVATVGVIYKETGLFWSGFSVLWSFVVAYGSAVIAYQVGAIASSPVAALTTIAITLAGIAIACAGLIYWGRVSAPQRLIPIKNLDGSV